jgi:hypothetical protein
MVVDPEMIAVELGNVTVEPDSDFISVEPDSVYVVPGTTTVEPEIINVELGKVTVD